jgi:uncharacterized protein (TIGR03437 family)
MTSLEILDLLLGRRCGSARAQPYQTTAGPLSFSAVPTVSFTVVINPPPPPVTPSITGVNLAAGNAAASPSPGAPILITGMNLGTGAGDVASFTIGGKTAPVLNFISQSTLLAQVPSDVPAGKTTIIANYKNQPSPPFAFTLETFSPALYDGSTVGCSDTAGNRISSGHPALANTSVTCAAIGLGPTNPPMVTGVKATAVAPITTPVQIMLGGKLVQPDYAGLLLGSITDYRVTFKIHVPIGNQPLFLMVSGRQSNTVMLSVAAPGPVIAGIVNNASYNLGSEGSSVAPGAIAAIFGSNLTDGSSCLPPTCGPLFGSNGRLNTTMAGAQVIVGSTPVPIFYATPTQLGIQIPFELAGTLAQVMVSVAGRSSPSTTTAVASVAPGIFTYTADGKGTGAFTHVDSSAVTTQNPAQPGELVILYATGLGAVMPAVATGALPAGASSSVSQVTLNIGGIGVIPDFAGLAGCCVGLNQINARIPAGVSRGNAVPVVLNINGKSSNTATISVQ